VQFKQRLDNQVDVNAKFTDSDGNEVTLAECMEGKPTVFVLAYYRCPMNCTDVLNGLLDAMNQMPQSFAAGGAFNVVTVSFDEREQPSLAKEKQKSYLSQYKWAGDPKGWRFLTGKKEPIRKIADAVGFRFVYDKVYKEYDHLSGIMVLRPDGRVFRYFYGISYADEKDIRYQTTESFKIGKTTLKLSLVEASDGQVGSLVDKLALRCFRFDHLERNYSMNVLLAVRVGAVLMVLGLCGGVGYYVRRERRKPPATDSAAENTGGTEGLS